MKSAPFNEESAFRTIADRVWGRARGGEVELIYEATDAALTRFSNNVVSQNVQRRGATLSVRVLDGKRSARATTDSFDDASLDRVLERAAEAARLQRESDSTFPLVGPQSYRSVKQFYPSTAALSPQQRVEAVEPFVRACEKASLSAAGHFSSGAHAYGYATSAGAFAFHRYSQATFSVTATSPTSTGVAETTVADVAALDAPAVGQRAVEIALQARNPRAIEAGPYTVILEHRAAAEILFFLGFDAFGGLAFVEKRSALSGKMGENLFGDNITITDDAYHPVTLGLPFDFEGLPRQSLTLVESGVVRAVVHDRRTARLTGATSTGHALPQPNPDGPFPLHLIMAPGDTTLDEMIRSTKRGILITRIHYANVLDPVALNITGMTRDGTFLIDNGRVAYPVHNLRFTDSIIRMLNNVDAISRDQKFVSAFFGGGYVMPALRINDFVFTSTAEF